jgi:glycosyltransferase involved in cell wall biosynthesis
MHELAQAAPANVELIPRFPYGDEEAIYSRACVFLNTSSFEGFPNALLQAARFGVPIVSAAVDPDGFIRRTGSGIVAGSDPGQLADAIRRLVGDHAQWESCSKAISAYVRQHEISACVAGLAEQLVELSRRSVPVKTVSA